MAMKGRIKPGQEKRVKQSSVQRVIDPLTLQREQINPATVSPQLTHVSPQALKPADILVLQRRIGNQAIRQMIAGQARFQSRPLSIRGKIVQRDEEKKPPSAIGYVGLNPLAMREAEALKKFAKDEVIASLDNPEAQKDFETEEGRLLFVWTTLGISPLNPIKFFLALNCLASCDPDFREQMADMMKMFHNAELGKYQLERLVLSGHHSEGEMWGDYEGGHTPGGLLPDRDLRNIAAAFPVAAGQVQDVMFSACNSTAQVELCEQLFPNLKSVWVYEGYSPSIKQGSAQHIVKWESKTRGEATPVKRDKMGNTAIWIKDKGFITGAGGAACGP